MSTFSPLHTAIISALLLPSYALAQQTSPSDDPSILLKEVNVYTPDITETESQKSYASSAMRTTTGLALAQKDTPQSVSVITRTQLNDQNINNLSDALRTTTGINVVADSGRYRYQSRGFYINQIEEDGIASSLVGGNSGNPYRDAQSNTDLAVYDHIEVVRGATGLTQSVGEPGGTINAVRKQPTKDFQSNAEISINNWGSLRTMGDVSGSLNPAQNLSGRLVGVVERNKGFKDNSTGNAQLLYGVLQYEPTDKDRLLFGGLYQNQKHIPDPSGLPMGLDGKDLNLPYDTYLGASWNKARLQKTNLFSQWEHDFNDDWRLTSKFSYTKLKSDSRFAMLANGSTRFVGVDDTGILPTNNMQRYNNTGHQFGAQLMLNGKYYLLNRAHDFFATYNYSHENADTRWRRVRNSTSYNIYDFTGNEIAQPNWDNAATTGNTDGYNDQIFYGSKIITHGLTLGTRFNPSDKAHILAGARYTRWKRQGTTDYDWWNNKPDSDTDESDTYRRNHITPYLGFTYDLTPDHSLYAGYSSIFKPQSSVDIDNKIISPIIGNNYEIGWKAQWNNGLVNTSLSLFQIDQKNRAISSGLKNNAGNYYSIASGHIRSRGLDAEISGSLTNDLELFAGYTYNRSKYLNTESTRYPAGMNFSKHTPVHLFRLYSHYHLPNSANKWSIGAGVRAQSATESIYGVKQGGYALWDANVQYQATPQLNFSLGVTNLFDKRYYENNKVRTNGMNNFYGEPRTFLFKFKWTQQP